MKLYTNFTLGLAYYLKTCIPIVKFGLLKTSLSAFLELHLLCPLTRTKRAKPDKLVH